MIDNVKRLIRRYPHIALGCCGVCLFVGSFIVSNNLAILFFYVWYPGRWVMMATGIAQLASVATGVIMIGGAILWGLRRRRSTS